MLEKYILKRVPNMILGIADTSFIASETFRTILFENEDFSFAMFSPLLWFFGYRRYAVRSLEPWDRFGSIDEFDQFCSARFGCNKSLNKELFLDNLKIGIKFGRILPIRNLMFSRNYYKLRPIIPSRSQYYNRILLRDLCNVLLSVHLQLPLWATQNSIDWIETNYHFTNIEKTQSFLLPLSFGNHLEDFNSAFLNLMTSYQKKININYILDDFESSIHNIVTNKTETFSLSQSVAHPLWNSIKYWNDFLSSPFLSLVLNR